MKKNINNQSKNRKQKFLNILVKINSKWFMLLNKNFNKTVNIMNNNKKKNSSTNKILILIRMYKNKIKSNIMKTNMSNNNKTCKNHIHINKIHINNNMMDTKVFIINLLFRGCNRKLLKWK